MFDTVVTFIRALMDLWKGLTDEQREIVSNLVAKAFEALLGDYYDWFTSNGGAAS